MPGPECNPACERLEMVEVMLESIEGNRQSLIRRLRTAQAHGRREPYTTKEKLLKQNSLANKLHDLTDGECTPEACVIEVNATNIALNGISVEINKQI